MNAFSLGVTSHSRPEEHAEIDADDELKLKVRGRSRSA
jgi:hypothetical protein